MERLIDKIFDAKRETKELIYKGLITLIVVLTTILMITV